MKSISVYALLLLLSCTGIGAQAQLLAKPNPALQKALQQVVTDFPQALKNITGELLQENGESRDYLSHVVLPGSESCFITQFNSQHNKNRSWQAVFAEMESFTTAKKKYKELYQQIKHGTLQLPGNTKGIKPRGEYQEPLETSKFSTSTFVLDEKNPYYKHVKIEVGLNYLVTGWQVTVAVFDKQEDENIRPEDVANDY